MFTLRFETDSRGTGPSIINMVEARSYRVLDHGNSKDVIVSDDQEGDLCHEVNGQEDGYDRCFVMNDNGRTVAVIAFEIAVQQRNKERVAG